MGRPKGSKNKTRTVRPSKTATPKAKTKAKPNPTNGTKAPVVSGIMTIGQTLCDLRAMREVLCRTRRRGLSPVYYEPLFNIININMKKLAGLLSTKPKKVEVWVMRLEGAPFHMDDLILGASEEACWNQLEGWVDDNWDECMHGEVKPTDPTEMVNEFFDHSGVSMECTPRPLPFLTSLPEPKKVDR